MKNRRLFFIGISISILIVLDYIYLDYMTNLFDGNVASFGKYGYPEGHINYIKLFFSVIFIVALSYVVPLTAKSPSTLILIVYYYVAIVPFLSLFTLGITASDSLNYVEFLNILIFYSVVRLLKNKNRHKACVKTPKSLRLKYYTLFVSVISLVLAGYLYISFASSSLIGLTNLLDVYSQREVFDKNTGIIGSLITGYIIYGVIPFYIFMYKLYDNKAYLLFSFLLGFVIFLATGSKLFLGSVFLMALLSKFYKSNFSHSKIGISLILLIFASYGAAIFFSSYMLLSVFVRRMLIIPAQLFALFHEHSYSVGLNYLAKYTAFFTGSDGVSIAHSIGDKYYRTGSSANNGMISDAYGNFGVLGVLFYALFFVWVFRYIDRLNIDMDLRLTPLFIGLAISLTNSSLLAVFVFQISMFIIIFKIYDLINKVKA